MDERDDERAVPRTVGRVLDLLEIVVQEPTNLTSAAHAAGLTPTTALRHLRALESRGYVARADDNSYSAGPTILRLAATVGDRTGLDRLVAVVQPHLDELAAGTGESAYLAVAEGEHATYVATAESERAIRHVGWVGQTVVLDGTAVGAALESPGACVSRTGAVEPDITAISYGLPPVGALRAAVSLIGPSQRLDDLRRAELEPLLREAAEAITAQIGVAPVEVAR